MSLLSNLSLDYEILADDPIEMGIRYGKSILSSVSSTVASTEQLFEQPKPAYAYAPISRASFTRADTTRQNATTDRLRSSITRRNFIDYSSRPIAMGYSRRNMVGAL